MSIVRHAAARAIGLCLAASALAQNQPPAAPVIAEPREGRIVNTSDLHMETEPFSDPNPGDTHRCTDWEVWTVSPPERIWVTSCIGGVERVHTHMGDGVFENSHAGRRTLLPLTDYLFRVRHRDSSDNPANEWSPWSSRTFTTAPLTTLFPMELDDVLPVPTPTLRDTSGGAHLLTPGASIRLNGSEAGGTLIEFIGRPAGGNQIVNPSSLPNHQAARVDITAGASSLTIPDLDMGFSDHDGAVLEIHLPALSLTPGETAGFWVAANGGTYVAQPGQTEPDFSSLARGPAVSWTTAPGFRAEIVATGFQMPVNIAFVPNPGAAPDSPLYYVVELYGQIKVVRRNGVVSDYATGLLNFNPTGNFPGSGEQGLAGCAVDTNGDLYITTVYAEVTGNEGSPHHPAVDRLTSTDGGLTMATRTRILNMTPEVQGQSHQISNLTFGPDGFLYVHVGDGFDAGAAQNLNFFRGKIIRINRSGQPLPGNPFYNAADGITATDYIYARGVRNPFGGAWRASDASHYIVENGPSVDRFARLVRGFNYGYTGSDASMQIGALYNWNPSTAPVNITFLQPETFGGSGFPAEYHGRAYVSQSGGTYAIGPGSATSKCITEWEINPDGTLAAGPRAVAYYNGGGASSAVALAAGPDGLYFSDFYKEDSFDNPIARGSSILRLRYVAPPPPPDCNTNGVPDADDIMAGTSQDCNANGVPDECDIAVGRSADCNLNGLPDECDTTSQLLADFEDGSPAPFVLNGSAVINNNAIRLTPANGNQLGTAIRPPLSPQPLTRLSASFDFRIGGGSGADGMCFAAFDASRYTTASLFSEEGPGTLDHNPPANSGALTVQFDSYDNGGGEGENTIEVMYNGVTLGRNTPPYDLEDDVIRRAFIEFDGAQITIRTVDPQGVTHTAFDRLAVPNYQPVVSLLGFGARTGGATNQHRVDNVSFGIPSANDTNGDGIPDECDCPADFNRDGGVDGADIEAFFLAWEISRPEADVNHDGGVDGGDVEVFFSAWEAGGC